MSPNQLQLLEMDHYESKKIAGHHVFRETNGWTVDGKFCSHLDGALRRVDGVVPTGRPAVID